MTCRNGISLFGALALPALGLAPLAAPASVTYFFEATVVDDIEGPSSTRRGNRAPRGSVSAPR